jgi:prepilin-type N-terminal cleavage/methylation domain-containing protein
MQTRRGFTFVELLVAVAVFGALTAVAVPRYHDFKERAYLSSMRSELGSLRVAQEAYWSENQTYSTDTTALDWNGSSLVTLNLSALNPGAGFTAEARHVRYPGALCATYVGSDAVSSASGEIICTASGSGVGSGLTP